MTGIIGIGTSSFVLYREVSLFRVSSVGGSTVLKINDEQHWGSFGVGERRGRGCKFDG